MSGYHYNNSKASTNKDEPVYLTKYEAIFVLPPPLRSVYGGELLAEQLKKIGGLSLDKLPESMVTQMYRYHSRRYAGSVVKTEIDLDMDFDVNIDSQLVLYPYNVMKAWSRLIYDPQTGFQTLKKDYCGSLTIKIHNKIGQVVRDIYFPIIFPSKPITDWNLEYAKEDIYKMSCSFAAENPTDLIIGNTGGTSGTGTSG